MSSSMGSRVKSRRKELGLTQANLAEMVGCSQPMIRKIEQGSETTMTRRLAAALRVSVDWLETGRETTNAVVQVPAEWPFSFSYQRLVALSEVDLARVDGYLLHLIEQKEAEKETEQDAMIKTKSLSHA